MIQPTADKSSLRFPEFVALLALLMSTVAYSIDSMLPALPQIALELTPDATNHAQLVVLMFVLGLGLGTFIAGPLSDAVGRKPAISAGILLYLLGAGAAYLAPTLELLLAARAVQGIGAAAPRIVSMALVRDTFGGRRMAQVMSFVMMVFVLVPAVAPSIGAVIIDAFSWRAVFISFVALGATSLTWMNVRQPETHPVEARRPFRPAQLWAGTREVLSNRLVLLYTAVLTLGSGQMFALVSSAQPIYDQTFDKAESFPRWFAFMAAFAGTSAFMNANLVNRLGMKRLAGTAYMVQTFLSIGVVTATYAGVIPESLAFPVFFVWAVSVVFMAGLTFGNLNALAMEKMGHIAGLTASVVGGVSLVLSTAIAIPIGLLFDGTPRALMVGVLLCSSVAWLLMHFSPGDAVTQAEG